MSPDFSENGGKKSGTFLNGKRKNLYLVKRFFAQKSKIKTFQINKK